MPNHIFISYAREDQSYVRELAEHLYQQGFEVWMDDRIDFGDPWWRTIVQALRASAAFVVVMTPDSENSNWVHREVLLALEERKPIFPLLLRGKRFPILVDTQYATVAGGRMPPDRFCDRLREVVSALEVAQEKKLAIPIHEPFEPEMVLIPAGEFPMGSDFRRDKEAEDDEQPQHKLYLGDYYIARTPVTNVQYAPFVQATFRQPPEHWEGGKPPRGKEHHPVVYVSWHDAVAYCNWLAEVTDEPYRLPSEAEWEKGARGTDGRIYPWGDKWDTERCNSEEAGIGDTTPVGAYPEGASPYGLLDMAGNIFEWTRSLRGQEPQRPDFGYPYDPGDGREDPGAGGYVFWVVRGGAFNVAAGHTRSGYRYKRSPNHRYGNFGFRVVRSAAHP